MVELQPRVADGHGHPRTARVEVPGPTAAHGIVLPRLAPDDERALVGAPVGALISALVDAMVGVEVCVPVGALVAKLVGVLVGAWRARGAGGTWNPGSGAGCDLAHGR